MQSPTLKDVVAFGASVECGQLRKDSSLAKRAKAFALHVHSLILLIVAVAFEDYVLLVHIPNHDCSEAPRVIRSTSAVPPEFMELSQPNRRRRLEIDCEAA